MKALKAAPLALFCLAACASAPAAQDNASLVARARDIQSRIATIDTHVDIEPSMGLPQDNPCLPTPNKADLPKMRQGGLDVAFFAVYVGQSVRNDSTNAKAKTDALAKFEAIHRLAEKTCPEQIEIAYHPEDVDRILKSGKLVAAIGIENGFVIGRDLSLISRYQQLGARYMTLAHNGNNDIAGSAQPNVRFGDPTEISGVTPFGEQVIAEMNRVGMMVDLSHVSKQSALDAMRLTKAPVIASHSSVVAITKHPRNFDDETLDALKKNGGVIQIVALGDFVKTPPPARTTELTALRTEFGLTQPAALAALSSERRAQYDRRLAMIEAKYPAANIEDFLNHIDYAVKRIGVDHVGISSDFDGGGGILGWNDASETINVTVGLLRRGYSEEEIGKMWGGNTLRVWRDVERIAKQLQARSAS